MFVIPKAAFDHLRLHVLSPGCWLPPPVIVGAIQALHMRLNRVGAYTNACWGSEFQRCRFQDDGLEYIHWHFPCPQDYI
jgi:hypothetical protein